MIYLIITSSIIDKNVHTKKDDEFRKQTYINSIKKTLSLLPSNIFPILVENNGQRETYLDTVGMKTPVFYTENNNNPKYYHKALNEMADIRDVIDKYQIKDEDMVIKITGRYYLYHQYFFDLVSQEENNYDVFMKLFNVSTMTFDENDCVMGLFAMRCKYLKKFKFIEELVEGQPSAEVQFCKYTKELNCRIFKVDFLYMTCCFADDLFITDL
jgi:hypothetical protein